MLLAEQGDVLKVQGIADLLLVVSNNVFNETGAVIACPIQEQKVTGVTHPPVLVQQKQSQTVGFVRCEDPKRLDLKVRRFRKSGFVDYFQMMDVSDILVGIFEYA